MSREAGGKVIVLKCCFTEMSHRDILKKMPYLYFFDYRVIIREKKFEADICCEEFLGRSIGTIR